MRVILLFLLFFATFTANAQAQNGTQCLGSCQDTTLFAVPRGLLEDYVTLATVTVPAYHRALASSEAAIKAKLDLILALRLRAGALSNQVSAYEVLLASERIKSSEYKSLYELAELAYRKERRLKRIAIVGGGTIIVVIAILK